LRRTCLDRIVKKKMSTAPSFRRADTLSTVVSRVAPQVLGRLAAAVLMIFHTWLLWTHVTLGKFADPDVALRWTLAGLLLAGFWALRRLGVPLFWGRRAVVLWILVIVIHAHAVWTGDAMALPVAVPQAVVNLVSLSVPVATIASLLFLVWLTRQNAIHHPRPRLSDVRPVFAGLPATVCALQFSPRPPPIA
jgi:hypothetical protein